jgi:hypothetical protein
MFRDDGLARDMADPSLYVGHLVTTAGRVELVYEGHEANLLQPGVWRVRRQRVRRQTAPGLSRIEAWLRFAALKLEPTLRDPMGVELTQYLIPRDNTHRPSPEQIAALITAWVAAGYVVKPGSPALANLAFGSGVSGPAAGPPAATSGAMHITKWSGKRAAAPFAVPPDTAALAVLAGPQARIQWPVSDNLTAGTVYPITPVPKVSQLAGQGVYYDLEIHVSDDFVDVGGESIVGYMDPKCGCGGDLRVEPADDDVFGHQRIRRTCPKCSAAFRPQDQEVEMVGGVEEAELSVAGGVTYRFAIVIDCGKCWHSDQSGGVERDPKASAEFVALCERALGCDLYQVGVFG